MEEEWRDIKGYEGFYQVSNLGNVRSLDRIFIKSNGRRYNKKGKILIPGLTTKGYETVNLSDVNHKITSKRVHRLVAEAFIPNPNNLPQVNHIDENKLNNFVTNLEWCTNTYNISYGTRNLRLKTALRGNNNAVKNKNKNLNQSS